MRLPGVAATLLLPILLIGCAGASSRDAGQAHRAGTRFVGGPEFRRSSALQARAIDLHREAFATRDAEERSMLLQEALRACAMAQEELQGAFARYPHYQREEIEFEMDAVHRLMLEIHRDLR